MRLSILTRLVREILMQLCVNNMRIAVFQDLFLTFLELCSSASGVDSLSQASFYGTLVEERQIYFEFVLLGSGNLNIQW